MNPGVLLQLVLEHDTLPNEHDTKQINVSLPRAAADSDDSPVSPDSASGLVSRSLVLRPYSLLPNTRYVMQLYGKTPGLATAFTELEMMTSRPPYGGSCRIDPPAGRSDRCRRRQAPYLHMYVQEG